MAEHDLALEALANHFESDQWNHLLMAVDKAIAAGIDLGIDDTGELHQALSAIQPLLDAARRRSSVATASVLVDRWVGHIEQVSTRYWRLYHNRYGHYQEALSARDLAEAYWDRLLTRCWENHDIYEIREGWLSHIDCQIGPCFFDDLEETLLNHVIARLRERFKAEAYVSSVPQ